MKLRRVRPWLLAAHIAVVLLVLSAGQIEAAAGGEGPPGPFWVHLVERFFIWFTAGIVAFGILQVELEVLHWTWSKVTGRKNAAVDGVANRPPSDDRLPVTKIRRFDIHQRVQHVVLLTTFIVLAITGISQKFYRSAPFDGLVALVGGLEGLRIIHRVAGIAMILDGAYHMLYVVLVILGPQDSRVGLPRLRRMLDMVPNLNDVRDFFQLTGYHLGVASQPPRFGHFSYMEKFDYWAVYWGLLIMATSGVLMLLPVLGIELTETPVIAAALAAHSDEAILAVVWIMIVHLYHAHLSPRVFPFNTTIFTGNISVERLREDHALEYARLVNGSRELPVGTRERPSRPMFVDGDRPTRN